IRVTLTSTNGVLSLSGIAGLAFGAGDGAADATMTFDGTVAAINTALAGLTFAPTGDYSGPASVRIVTNDLGATGVGGALTDDDTVNITVNAVNDLPVLGNIPANASYTEGAAPVLLAPAGTASDVEGIASGGTLTISGMLLEDRISIRNQGNGAGQI